MTDRLRWGILGTGRIAHKFAGAVGLVEGAELVAVGSRKQETADRFAEEFGIPHRHGSYDALAGDADVQAVYVATPHPFHMPSSVLCLQAGKAVLCEKPFTINARQAEKTIRAARANKLFCMEAMWSRFLPAQVKLRQLLAAGAIGEPRMVISYFGFRAEMNPRGRLFDPALGGGGLLDVGIYQLAFASMVFGRAQTITGQAHLGRTGVDEQAAVVLGYGEGRLAVIGSSVQADMPQEARILGTDGTIHLPLPFTGGAKITLARGAKDVEEIELPVTDNGFSYEIEEVCRCIAAGKTESDVMPLAETLSLMKTMDEIRAQWGLKYPME